MRQDTSRRLALEAAALQHAVATLAVRDPTTPEPKLLSWRAPHERPKPKPCHESAKAQVSEQRQTYGATR